MHFLTYKDKSGEWRWTLYAKNGRKIADSAEGYKRRGHCAKMIARIIVELKTWTPIQIEKGVE